MSKTRIRVWHKRFLAGRDSFKDDKHTGHPRSGHSKVVKFGPYSEIVSHVIADSTFIQVFHVHFGTVSSFTFYQILLLLACC